MIEAPIPQDILKYKAKFIGNFSTRETICLGIGVAAAVTGYFGWFNFENETLKMICCTLSAAIPFLFGFERPYGLPLEQAILFTVVENYIWPIKRYKETRHPEYEKYSKNENKKATPSREYSGLK